MTDTANPETGATGVRPATVSDGLDYDTAASLLEGALEREEQAETQARERDESGRFVARDERYQGEEAEADEAEAEAEEGEAEESDGTEAAEETGEAEEDANYSSVVELAEALEMPLDEFLANIKVPVKIDGQEQMVTLSEARDGFQMQSAFTKRTQELAEQRKAFEAERNAQMETLNQSLQQAQTLSKAMESALVADYEKVNWDELRFTDPAEFAAKRQEFAERIQGIEYMKAQVGQESAKQQEATQQEQQQRLQQHLAKEAEALLTKVPEWHNADKAKAEKAELREYMQANGFTDDEMAQLYDHRAVVMLRKAMMYDRGEQSKNVAKKKVAKLPKLTKKGTKPNPKEAQRRTAGKKFDALKKTGKVDEAAALFFDMEL